MSYLRDASSKDDAGAARLLEYYGFVPAVFRAQTALPRLLETEVSLAGAILFNDSKLSRAEKESILLAQAAAHRDSYCVALEYQTLLVLGVAVERLDALIANPAAAEFPRTLDALLCAAWASFVRTLAAGLGVAPDFAPPAMPDDGGTTRIIEAASATPAAISDDSPDCAFLREEFGLVPTLFQAQAARPDVLKAEVRFIKELFSSEGALSRPQKKSLILTLSGLRPREEAAPAEDAPLLEFGRKLTASPAAVGQGDIDLLGELGFRDVDILEAVATASLAAFLIHLQSGFGTGRDSTVHQGAGCDTEKIANLPPEGHRLTGVGDSADPDWPSIEAVLAGNTDAFEMLIERHSRRVYRTLLGIIGEPEEARDAMQDTYLKAFQHLGDFHGRSKFSTWLLSIASNTGLQRLRDRKHFESLDEGGDSEETYQPRQIRAWTDDPEQLHSKSEMRSLVESSVMKLPAKYRVVVILRDVEQLSAGEAAAVLGLGIPALKSRLLRGRLMLREALAPHFSKGAREVVH